MNTSEIFKDFPWYQKSKETSIIAKTDNFNFWRTMYLLFWAARYLSDRDHYMEPLSRKWYKHSIYLNNEQPVYLHNNNFLEGKKCVQWCKFRITITITQGRHPINYMKMNSNPKATVTLKYLKWNKWAKAHFIHRPYYEVLIKNTY